jgi:hypothetical protein
MHLHQFGSRSEVDSQPFSNGRFPTADYYDLLGSEPIRTPPIRPQFPAPG